MVKYCKNCGSKLDDDDTFCDECGTRILDVNSNQKYSNDFFKQYRIDMMENEQIIRHSKINIGCLILPALIFAIGIIIGIINAITAVLFYYYYTAEFILIGFFNIITIIGLIWFIIRFIGYKTNDLILTNKRVFGKYGLISTTQMQSPLTKIDSVSYSNGLIGKLLGYGTVKISTTSNTFKFRFIHEGHTFYNDIFNQIEE